MLKEVSLLEVPLYTILYMCYFVQVCRDYCTRVKDSCTNFYEYFTNFLSVSGITKLVIPQCNEGDSDVLSAGESPECSMPIPVFLGSG